ncbi:MAG: hypothetical protein ACXW3Z_14945 [Limisphaerales bacterium]
MKTRIGRLTLAWVALSFLQPAEAIVPGQVDDFEDGTLMSWAGAPGALVNITTGGPIGLDDNFMQMTADGSGQGGRLTTFNLNQWLGNYVGQGITTIEIDLRNQGNVPLSIRFAWKTENIQTTPGYLSPAMILPVGGGWQHFSIAITPANLIAVDGPASFNTFFGGNGFADFRIIHEVGTSNLNGDLIVSQLGIDNIRAVPEPGSVAFVAGGALLFAFRRFRSRAL